jgi:hypothetical protein
MGTWQGSLPTECQFCHQKFRAGDKFIDGKTNIGPWGILCQDCHAVVGVGLGTGRGQLYSYDTLAKEEG